MLSLSLSWPKRRQYLINRRFQFAVIGYAVAAACVVMAILYGSNLYFFHRFGELGKSLGLPENHVYFDFLREQVTFMTKIFVVVSSLILGVLFVGGVLISHRIAGPIYKICRKMNKVADGEPAEEIQFRNNDFFPELAEAYNRQLRYFRDSKDRADPAA